MSFSAAWLALREPVDHVSRNADLARKVTRHFAAKRSVRVVDLGCGTGSNLRATALLLPSTQEWLLVDYDPALLAVARHTLTDWADQAQAREDALLLAKGTRKITVRFRQADLAQGAAEVLGPGTDLVTASALFDLISAPWIACFAQEVASVRAAFYTVLTYDGSDTFVPPHALDKAVVAAFAAHQKQDKGFGIAAGPDAPDALARGFAKVGYRIEEASSPWDIRRDHADLASALLAGIAHAVGETGRVAPSAVAEWLNYRLDVRTHGTAHLVTGHRDTFAFPVTS